MTGTVLVDPDAIDRHIMLGPVNEHSSSLSGSSVSLWVLKMIASRLLGPIPPNILVSLSDSVNDGARPTPVVWEYR